MSERVNRLVLGFCLISFLLLEWNYGVLAIIFVLIFEGVTNWRIPLLISKMRYAMDGVSINITEDNPFKYHYEAERVTRFTVATTILLGFVVNNDLLWFLPYFVGLNLLLAGITGLCPLVMFYKKIGFR